jgi:uncharacterized protein YndB with AHSA1/START domain
MPAQHLIAKCETIINAPIDKVWEALITPEQIKEYMFGANVKSEWNEGSSITWSGDWQGTHYEDKGTILQLIPYTRLQYTHYSPMGGQPDLPENYHLVTVDLTDKDRQTIITLTQGNNRSEEEVVHSRENWDMMLEKMKQVVENRLHR